MAMYNKFHAWINTMCGGAVLVGPAPSPADMLIAYLSNGTPSATDDVVKADLAEIATGHGYSGPVTLDNVGTVALGVLTVVAKSFLVTATEDSIGPFRHVVVANDTRPSDPLCNWFDYGAAITLASGETFAVLFNGAPVSTPGTLFTVR